MKTFTLLLGFLIFAACSLVAPAVLAAPALLGMAGGAAGTLLLVGALQPTAAPTLQARPDPVQVAADPGRVRVVELGKGIVVFRTVDGKLVSRFYRA